MSQAFADVMFDPVAVVDSANCVAVDSISHGAFADGMPFDKVLTCYSYN